jgi:protein SCO1
MSRRRCAAAARAAGGIVHVGRMSANQPVAAGRRPSSPRRHRWLIWGAAGLLAAAVLAFLLVKAFVPEGSSGPVDVTATWPAGARPAPAFALHDEQGNPLTLASLRGRPAIVTFIDPLCRDFCPREASVLSEAAAALGKDAPAIVSVSVNPWADTPANFRADAAHWRLAPGWRWGVGSYAELADVWKRYAVGVQVTKKKIAGVTVRNIVHTGAAYLIDADGNERALFLYPFTTGQVVSATRDMLASGT